MQNKVRPQAKHDLNPTYMPCRKCTQAETHHPHRERLICKSRLMHHFLYIMPV